MDNLSIEELNLIKQEYAPQGICFCKKEELGCPFCNPSLRMAWKNSREKELQLLLEEI